MNSQKDILQEGVFKLLKNKKPLGLRTYTITSDGTLTYGTLAEHSVKEIGLSIVDISRCEFEITNVQMAMIGGPCVRVIESDHDPIVIQFETPLDLKKFCFVCYKICRKSSLEVRDYYYIYVILMWCL